MLGQPRALWTGIEALAWRAWAAGQGPRPGELPGWGLGRGDALPLGATSCRPWSNCGSVAPRVRAQPGPLGGLARKCGQGPPRRLATTDPGWTAPSRGAGKWVGTFVGTPAPDPPSARPSLRQWSAREGVLREDRERDPSWDRAERRSHFASLPPPLAAPGSGTTLCDTVPPVLVKKSHRPMRIGVRMGEGLLPFRSPPRMGWSVPPSPAARHPSCEPTAFDGNDPPPSWPNWTRSCGGGAGTGSGEVVDAGQILDAGNC